MLRWSIAFLLFALIAGVLGFGGLAGTAAGEHAAADVVSRPAPSSAASLRRRNPAPSRAIRPTFIISPLVSSFPATVRHISPTVSR